MMNPINEQLSFKSLENSINKDDKDWAILSIKITKNKSSINLGCKYCLHRKIAYLDKYNSTYQIGSLYVPINSFIHVAFFINLIFSRKTFGHFISIRYPEMYRFKLINEIEIDNGSNLLFKSCSKIRISERLLLVPYKKLKFYVQEELEIN